MKDDLQTTARAMVADGKGILAADESTGTIEKRFKAVGVESTEENRRAYRDLLFTTQGASEFISGVILYDETIRQKAADGTSFPQLLTRQGVLPGIKVDKGAKDLALHPGEKITEGLDGLRERLAEYVKLGARFAKWRAVITIAEGIPTPYCQEANARALARYAALCQEAGVVPIVEPEVLMDGDHTIDRAEVVTETTLRATFEALEEARVMLEGTILKSSMVVSGKGSRDQAGVREVAERTIRCLLRSVPAAIPGIVFLSGGQSEQQATAHLNAMNAIQRERDLPWELSFSYGRALQESAQKAWRGQAGNVAAAQKAYHHRARMNGLARSGKYAEEMERELTAA
ncbi:MAG: class I fructose-bisphosphate aldolase [Gemmatimonadota bacterium]